MFRFNLPCGSFSHSTAWRLGPLFGRYGRGNQTSLSDTGKSAKYDFTHVHLSVSPEVTSRNMLYCCLRIKCNLSLGAVIPNIRHKGPGAYDVRKANGQCLKNAPAISFGGALNRVDREKTGALKMVGEKGFVPGPCAYAVEAEDQVIPSGTGYLHCTRAAVEELSVPKLVWPTSRF